MLLTAPENYIERDEIMESKKIIATALAATIAASVSPINVMGDSEIDNFDLGYSADNQNDDLMQISTGNIDVRKVSETDTSITVSWDGFNNEKVSSYTVICDGLESEKYSTIHIQLKGCQAAVSMALR